MIIGISKVLTLRLKVLTYTATSRMNVILNSFSAQCGLERKLLSYLAGRSKMFNGRPVKESQLRSSSKDQFCYHECAGVMTRPLRDSCIRSSEWTLATAFNTEQ